MVGKCRARSPWTGDGSLITNSWTGDDTTEGVDNVLIDGDRSKIPPSAIQLAIEMFAGETGLSGPQIHSFFAQYSDEIPPYEWKGGSPSRKQLFATFLSKLPPNKQIEALLDLCDWEGPMKHGRPSDEQIERLRGLLLGSNTPALEAIREEARRVGWRWVLREWQRAAKQVGNDPDDAITAARSLVETVCKHVLDILRVPYDDSMDLPALYRLTARHLPLLPNEAANDAVRQVLGGCMSIVHGLSTLRNRMSDAHGRGLTYTGATIPLAKLAVNSAGTIAAFLIGLAMPQDVKTLHQDRPLF